MFSSMGIKLCRFERQHCLSVDLDRCCCPGQILAFSPVSLSRQVPIMLFHFFPNLCVSFFYFLLGRKPVSPQMVSYCRLHLRDVFLDHWPAGFPFLSLILHPSLFPAFLSLSLHPSIHYVSTYHSSHPPCPSCRGL